MEYGRGPFKISKGKPTGNILLGRPIHRWEDSNRIIIKEIGINTRDKVGSAQDRDYWRALENTVLNLRAP